MNYTKLLSAALILLLLWSCKKNDSNNPEQNAELDPSDSKSLFQNITVNHGAKVDGALPAASTKGPVLDESVADKTIPSIAGKYAIIHPEIVSGEIAGYYLRITGYSDAYYKVDFSKPVSGRKKSKISKRFSPVKKVMDDNPDYMDSAIIIRLPDNIKPGTFCMEYLAYDWNNNTSNIVKQCVTVSKLGGEEKLVGKWSMGKWKYENEDTIYFPSTDTSFYDYYVCGSDNKLSITSSANVNAQMLPTEIQFEDYVHYQFSADGSGLWEYRSARSKLDLDKTTCDKLIFTTSNDIENLPFIWSYDVGRKKLVLIDNYETPQDAEVGEWDVSFSSGDKISWYWALDPDYFTYYEFTRIP